MTRISPSKLAFASLLTIALASSAHASLFGDDVQTPTLEIAPVDITIDVPMPVTGANLSVLLAQSGGAHDLKAIKDAALQKYRQHLEETLNARLNAYFTDEEVPLVKREGILTLHNRLNVKVVKHFSNLESEAGYEVEQGTVELSGSFEYQLGDTAGNVVQQQDLNLTKMRISKNYQVKTPRNGGQAEDTTELAIKQALTEMTDKIVRKIDGGLEAGDLRDIIADSDSEEGPVATMHHPSR
ncbi:hypothetical protein [Microbulbifer hainanensis]|uniref:hypothetical protein n=1 Tax=Microbulbifer hainanensis TaxID=2735675 RepID=UPI0018673CD2|nr:hypothetical protein [Microbulbifer hainanensis]